MPDSNTHFIRPKYLTEEYFTKMRQVRDLVHIMTGMLQDPNETPASARAKLRSLPPDDLHHLAKFSAVSTVYLLIKEIGEPAVPGLLIRLRDSDSVEERIAIMKLVGELRASVARSLLQKLATDANPDIQKHAQQTLQLLDK
ncbi:MAG: HEAT repeat domain-containing protein [bacterium]|nr:HEAT repeat domain-containing protein [bacterium]